MTSFPEFHASGGSPSLLQQWRTLSSGVQCGEGWVLLNERLPVHSKGPWLGYHSTVPRRQRRLVWTRSVFASFSCAASSSVCDTRGARTSGFSFGELCRAQREAGARMSTNIRVQDFDLLPGGQLDDRRLPVVADGLPLFHGAQLAIDAVLVSLVRADGAPRRQCATRDGAALDQARRTKERRYPQLTGEHGRARLVVFACETGGRWSEEVHDFLRHHARARARSEPPEIRAVARRSLVQMLVHSIVMLCCAGLRHVHCRSAVGLMARCHRLPTWSGATGSPRELSAPLEHSR